MADGLADEARAALATEARWESCDLEGVAARAHGDARALDAEALARRHACPVVHTRDLPTGIDGLCLPSGALHLRARRDPRREALALLHELAHALLAREGDAHTHADVWYLTLALAAPLTLLRRQAEGVLSLADLHWLVQMPAWVLDLRAELVAPILAA